MKTDIDVAQEIIGEVQTSLSGKSGVDEELSSLAFVQLILDNYKERVKEECLCKK